MRSLANTLRSVVTDRKRSWRQCLCRCVTWRSSSSCVVASSVCAQSAADLSTTTCCWAKSSCPARWDSARTNAANSTSSHNHSIWSSS